MATRSKHQKFAFTDDIMFKRVMDEKDICKGVIGRLIGKAVGDVEYQNTEQEIRMGPTEKVIRTDSYLVESNGVLYDVEMQVEKNSELPLRMRGYQSILDGSVLWRGKDYDSLLESYIVFICTSDPFGAKLPIYSLERRCVEKSDVKFDCKSHWIAINASAYEVLTENEPLKSLLRYIETGEVSEGDDLVERIAREVDRNNADEKWVDAMLSPIETVKQEARVKARREGRAEGRAQGLAEGREEGRSEGRAEGRAEASRRYANLIAHLVKEGKTEELEGLGSDPDQFERLCEKYGF